MDKSHSMSEPALRKVPEITLIFWIIKIASTTVGETAGDAFSMSLGLGYALSSLLLTAIFLVVLAMQIRAKTFRPFLYWAVVVATTTVGTTLADLADRSLGVGYVGGSVILAICLAASLVVWRLSAGEISIGGNFSRKVETFYWITILFSNTLGTALGDFFADGSGLGYEGGALVFVAALTVIAGLYFLTKISHTMLFWAAFILTRPLGATVGDLLTKPMDHGGLDLSRVTSSAVLAAFIVALVALAPRPVGVVGVADRSPR